MNGQQFLSPINFTFHGEPELHLISPSSGPREGGTLVQLSGAELDDLGSHYECEFNGTVVPASLAPALVSEYVDFTEQYSRVHLPNVFRSPGVRLQQCSIYRSLIQAAGAPADNGMPHRASDPHDSQRVSAAIAACVASDVCESVYYNECDPSPRPLYLCPISVSFEDDLAIECPYRKVKTYLKSYGMHCRGQHYGNFSSVARAVAACNADESCGGVYDHQCDSGSGDVYLCPKQMSYSYGSQDAPAYVPPPRERSMREAASSYGHRGAGPSCAQCRPRELREKETTRQARLRFASQSTGNNSWATRRCRSCTTRRRRCLPSAHPAARWWAARW